MDVPNIPMCRDVKAEVAANPGTPVTLVFLLVCSVAGNEWHRTPCGDPAPSHSRYRLPVPVHSQHGRAGTRPTATRPTRPCEGVIHRTEFCADADELGQPALRPRLTETAGARHFDAAPVHRLRMPYSRPGNEALNRKLSAKRQRRIRTTGPGGGAPSATFCGMRNGNGAFSAGSGPPDGRPEPRDGLTGERREP